LTLVALGIIAKKCRDLRVTLRNPRKVAYLDSSESSSSEAQGLSFCQDKNWIDTKRFFISS